jgi:hypothetical protein
MRLMISSFPCGKATPAGPTPCAPRSPRPRMAETFGGKMLDRRRLLGSLTGMIALPAALGAKKPRGAETPWPSEGDARYWEKLRDSSCSATTRPSSTRDDGRAAARGRRGGRGEPPESRSDGRRVGLQAGRPELVHRLFRGNADPGKLAHVVHAAPERSPSRRTPPWG